MDYSNFCQPSTSSASIQTEIRAQLRSNLIYKSKNAGLPFNVIVEGNIASGKTAFLDYFLKYKSLCEIHPEPVEAWRSYNGANFLVSYIFSFFLSSVTFIHTKIFFFNLQKLLYEDKIKWSFPFQSFANLTFLKIHKQPSNKTFKFMERSIFSAKLVCVFVLIDIFSNFKCTIFHFSFV